MIRRQLILLALMSGSVIAQDRSCPTETKYDRFKDETVEVCSILTRAPASISLLNLTTNVRYATKSRQRPAQVTLLVLSQLGALDNTLLSPEFDLTPTLYLLSDSERLELLGSNPKPSLPRRGMIMEAVKAELNHETISAILKARTFGGRIGRTEFKFTDEELRILQSYLKTLTPIIGPLPRKR